MDRIVKNQKLLTNSNEGDSHHEMDCNSKSIRIIKDKAFPYWYSMIASLLFNTIGRRNSQKQQ